MCFYIFFNDFYRLFKKSMFFSRLDSNLLIKAIKIAKLYDKLKNIFDFNSIS